MAGIYIHIPFCRQACYYCDFHFSTNRTIEDEMVEAINKELEHRKDYLKTNVVNTIYFGGGTPSLLKDESLAAIFNCITKLFRLAPRPEITLEANPDDLTCEKLTFFKSLGISRLSIGIQTFNDTLLDFLNRANNSTQAKASVEMARTAGFDNISIDLIYAIPGQHNDIWLSDIQCALRLNPEHISGYALTIEEKTVFGKWQKSAKLKPVADDLAADQLYLLMDQLEANGYEHYEISNFARPGYYSQHNSNYWRQVYYLGVGPGAHSFNGISRQANIANNHIYIKKIREGSIPAEIELLTRQNRINEYILTALRTGWGLDSKKLQEDFDYDVLGKNRQVLNRLEAAGYITVSNHIVRLTRPGKLLADKIAADLFELNK